MKIKAILTEHRNDFTATLECEHCGAVQPLKTGYHDTYYHTRVIPALFCQTCHKNRAGQTEEGAHAV
jgi:hypothetical protein